MPFESPTHQEGDIFSVLFFLLSQGKKNICNQLSTVPYLCHISKYGIEIHIYLSGMQPSSAGGNTGTLGDVVAPPAGVEPKTASEKI